MASPSFSRDLKALYRLVNQADLVLHSMCKPHPSVASARESLNAALALSKDLITRSSDNALKVNPAVALGARGGSKTAERGPDYFKKIAAMRKERKGGRPKKAASE